MEVSVIGRTHTVVKFGGGVGYMELGGFDLRMRKSEVVSASRWSSWVFVGPSRSSSMRSNSEARLRMKAMMSVEPVESKKVEWDLSSCNSRSRPVNKLSLYVGLPLDTVSECHTMNHARAITTGLKVLKLMGVDGVELPVWWGIVEKDSTGKYKWSGYLIVAELVRKMGLKLHVSLCFHACRETKVGLPDWVCSIGENDPGLFFTDRSGKQYRDSLSLAVDDLPVLDGKTPSEVYRGFCESFKSTFAPFMGSTITGITMGLGPDGELRYPSNHLVTKTNATPGAGEFQCYDQNMLNHLKKHSEATGHLQWGHGGPHDAPSYDEPPTGFFKDGGSWETPYGDYFLSWYTTQLISHGDRLLSLASTIFSDTPVSISGRVPIVHSLDKTRSHPGELTAGFYNTVNREGYEAVAAIFAKNSCRMILPGMDLLDEHQPHASSPQLLLAQIKAACKKHGVDISGEKASDSVTPDGFEAIRRNLLVGESGVDVIMYQRMGASFFSPEHFPLFTEFVRGHSRPELHTDDVLEEDSLYVASEAGIDVNVLVV